jgi:hypothetical protein
MEVLVLGVDLSVHLGRRRPRGNPAIPRAPCAPARCRRALRVDSVSRLGRVGPNSISEWAGLAGRHKTGPAAQFGRGPHPAQEAEFIQILVFEFCWTHNFLLYPIKI